MMYRMRSAFAVGFLILVGPDNQPIEIQADKITTMRPPRHAEHFAMGVKCIIYTDAHFVAVKESCPEVNQMAKGK